MTISNDYDFNTTMTMLNSMTDEEAKEYFDDLQAEYWIEEYKNNSYLM